MIVARDLSKTFGKVRAVDSMNFVVPRGGVVGFLGPNGAGKTTTIRMIAGFLPPSSGTVEVDGRDVRRDPIEVRRRIGYLPEATPLYGEMRVEEYLAFRGRLAGVPRRDRRTAIDRALGRCDLLAVRRRTIRHLSKGFRQRVGLAAAVLHEPPVLILDEPTVGLDPRQMQEFRALIRELAGRHTILLSTHVLPEAELVCDRILLVARGRVEAQGTLEELRAGARGAVLVETDDGAAGATLAALRGVASVATEGTTAGWTRFRIEPTAAGPALAEAVARALAARGATLRELRRETPTLESLFLERIGLAGAATRPAPAPGEPTPAGEAAR